MCYFTPFKLLRMLLADLLCNREKMIRKKGMQNRKDEDQKRQNPKRL